MKKSLTFLILFFTVACLEEQTLNDNISSLADQSIEFELEALTILQNKCSFCHANGASSGGVSDILNKDYLIKEFLIEPGNAENSLLYKDTVSGFMPPGPNLSAEEQEVLKLWIDSL